MWPSEESQNGWGWKAPLEVILPNAPGQAGPPRASCPGPCPRQLSSVSKVEGSTTSPSNLFQCLVTLIVKNVLPDTGTSCVSVCAYCHWSCHWAPLKRARLHLLCNPHFRYLYTLIRSPFSLLFRLNSLLFTNSASSHCGCFTQDAAMQAV